MRPYIVKAIVKRDLRETSRNPQTLIILGITIGINLILSLSLGKALWVMTFSMCLVMIGFTLTSFMITEEKDKKTLEALLVSPASYNEVLFGKVFVSFITTVLITYGLSFFLHSKEISIIHSLIAIPLGAFVICLFGVVVGLICQTQAMLSGVGTLLMLMLFLPELLASINEYIGILARALPTHHIIQLAGLGKDGFSPIILKHYIVLLFSLFATIFWAYSFLKIAGTQEGRKWKYSKLNLISSFILLLTLTMSSIVFHPKKGEIVQGENQKSFYQNLEYAISFPFDAQVLEFKEFRFQDKFIVKFYKTKSPEDYIYLTAKKNSKGLSSDEYLAKRLEEVKKETVMNLRRDNSLGHSGMIMNKFSYETKDGESLYHIFNNKKFLYRVGIDSKKENKKLYDFLTLYLEKNLQGIRVID